MSEPTNAGPRARHARTRTLLPAALDRGAEAICTAVLPGANFTPFQLGHYRVGEQLGRGGMGTVYRAEHVHLKKPVALKVLFPGSTGDRRTIARFQLEMEVVGKLDHPNIVRATDAGEIDGVHFLVMELVDGINLAHLLKRFGPLPVPEACELVRQAAIGLQHAHEHGLVHRDVKPSNLMLSPAGQVKVLDLGLALLRAPDAPTPELTAAGEVLGTAEYMAPEQWAEMHAVDIRADVYSLGCTLYALLAGAPPFVSSGHHSFRRLMAAHQTDAAPPITDNRPDAPPALCALLGRMLAKCPNDRPATPGAVAAELGPLAGRANPSALLESVSTPKGLVDSPQLGAPKAGPVSVQAPQARTRSRLFVALLAVALVATVVGACFAVLVPRTAAPEPKKWRNLLAERHDEQRLRRLWVDGPISKLDHDRKTETLWVQSAGHALVRLGDAPAPAYKLQVAIRQVRWEGGAGIYFGGRVETPPNEFVFQYLTLRRTNHGTGREYGLVRGGGRFALEPKPKPGVRTVEFQTEYVPPPDNDEKLLEVEIKRGGVALVRWEGTPCPELVGARTIESVTKLFPDGGLTGEFGVYCTGNVTITAARYIPTE